MLSTTPRSGPRACRTCAIVKAKCVWEYEGSESSAKCKRCNRLKKECALQTPARRDRKVQRKTRISQIEEKIDSLSSILQHSAPLSQQAESSNIHPNEHQNTISGRHDTSSSRELPSKENGEQLLKFYREEMAPQFPFVVIPPDMTATDLERERPFLYRCVMMVGSQHDQSSQTIRIKEAVAYLAEHILVQAERDLDLLQGILVYLGWFHNTIHTGRRLNAMLSLAMAMMVDIGINGEPEVVRPPGSVKWALKSFMEPQPSYFRRTLEERRAFLGIYYLSSVLSVYFLYLEPMRFSAYVEKCLHVLATDEGRVQSDQYLIQLVRLQAIAQEMSEARVDAEYRNDSPAREAIPLAGMVRTLQKKLERFTSELPTNFRRDPILLMHFHSILIYLTEIGLSVPLPSRQATLHVCLSSAHSFLAALFSMPENDIYKIPYVSWIQILYVLPVLSKLSHFESDDWDPSHVRGVVDLSLVLEGLIRGIEETIRSQSSGDGPPGYMAAIGMTVLRRFTEFKEAFEVKRDELEAARSFRHSPASLTDAQPAAASLGNSPSHSGSYNNSPFMQSQHYASTNAQNSSSASPPHTGNPAFLSAGHHGLDSPTNSADPYTTSPPPPQAPLFQDRAQEHAHGNPYHHHHHHHQPMQGNSGNTSNDNHGDGSGGDDDGDSDDIGIMFDCPYDAFWEEMMQDFPAAAAVAPSSTYPTTFSTGLQPSGPISGAGGSGEGIVPPGSHENMGTASSWFMPQGASVATSFGTSMPVEMMQGRGFDPYFNNDTNMNMNVNMNAE